MARNWDKLNKVRDRKAAITPKYKEIQTREQAGESITDSEQSVLDEYMSLQGQLKILFHEG